MIEKLPNFIVFCVCDLKLNIGQNDKDKCGLTPFMNACINGQADVVKSYGFSNHVFKQM